MSETLKSSSSPVIVFDLDGTLVSSMEDLLVTLNVVLTGAGYSAIDTDRVKTMIGHGAKVLLQRGLEYNNATWSEESLGELYETFLRTYEDHIADHTRPFPGVLACIDRLKAKGYRVAICTNKIERLTFPLLEALDLTRHFDAIVAADTFATRKPDAEPVLGAIARAGGVKQGSVMVGDSVTDIDAARAAGIPVIAVDFGYTPVPVTELGPDQVISHYDEFDAALEKLLQESV